MVAESFDALVLGAGLRGLAAALRVRRERVDARLLVVDKEPRPGGSLQTQRNRGFLCELGAFAFARGELDAVLGLLAHPPIPSGCAEPARSGWLFTGERLQPIAVDPQPLAFRSGNEELEQACRRELGPALRVGRPVVAIEHDGAGFVVQLGGEVPALLAAPAVVIALPDATGGRVLARFDPRLGDVAARVETAERAFVFCGGPRACAPEIRGYGVVPAPAVTSPVAEMIFCSEVFPGRAPAGQFLVRLEMAAAPAAADAEILTTAEAELRRWTGLTSPLPFQRLHRFATAAAGGAAVECRARLRELPGRVAGLTVA